MRNNDGNFFINMSDSLFPLFIDGPILDYRLKLASLSGNVETLQIFNKNFEEYAITTPLFYVIEDDFYLKIGNEIYYILVKIDYFIDKPGLKNDQKNVVLSHFANKMLPGDFSEKETILNFHEILEKNLQKVENKFVNVDYFKNLVFESINQISMKKKKELELLEFKIGFLEKKLENLLNAKEEIDKILEKKGRKRDLFVISHRSYLSSSMSIFKPKHAKQKQFARGGQKSPFSSPLQVSILPNFFSL